MAVFLQLPAPTEQSPEPIITPNGKIKIRESNKCIDSDHSSSTVIENMLKSWMNCRVIMQLNPMLNRHWRIHKVVFNAVIDVRGPNISQVMNIEEYKITYMIVTNARSN